MGTPLGQRAQELWQAVVASRRAQLASMGTKGAGQTQRTAAREALADVLFLNLLVLLAAHHTAPERVRAFFPQAILKEFTGLKADEAPGAGAV